MATRTKTPSRTARTQAKPAAPKFPPHSTAGEIAHFKDTLRQHSAKNLGDPQVILRQIGAIRRATPVSLMGDKIQAFLEQRAEAVRTLIGNYLVAVLSARFPLIDPALFALKRHLYVLGKQVSRDYTKAIAGTGGRHLVVDLFVSRRLNQTDAYRLASYDTPKGTFRLSVLPPPVPEAVLMQGHQAIGAFHAAVAALYAHADTNDLVRDALDDREPTLSVLWIPAPAHITIEATPIAPRNSDPALIMSFGGHSYLVALWDIPEELPLETTLREFTVGKVKFPAKTAPKK